MTKNIILCGVGGQGTVLASRLISAAAMDRGLPVMSAETIGMAQRGGSVFSHLRIGEGVYCPMIARGEADLILGFEPGEAVRMLPWLKPGGTVVTSDRGVTPVTVSLTGTAYDPNVMVEYLRKKVDRLIVLDAERALREVGSQKVLNLILLGAAIRTGALGMTAEDLEAAMKRLIQKKYLELNQKALKWAGKDEQES